MKRSLLDSLQCSYCGQALAVAKILAETADGIEFGILNCSGCRQRYPIVARIPILLSEQDHIHVKAETRDRVLFAGPTCRELVALLLKDKPQEAFERLINPPIGTLRVPGGDLLSRLPGMQRVASYLEWKSAQMAAPKWRRQFVDELKASADRATAMSVLRLYYGGLYKQELMNYFMFRFGQPRHLVALSIIQLLDSGKGPILDLACGIGHLSHYFCAVNPHARVVGVDRNFFQLFIAKHYVSPESDFICFHADQTLPFRDRAFGGIFCSDAFHYFISRLNCALELQRLIAEDGVIAVTRVGNVKHKPNEGYELEAEGYRRLFAGMPSALVSEERVLDRYLNKQGPNLDGRDPVDGSKWLSLVATKNADLFREHGTFDHWPHAAGTLQLNPLYNEVSRNADTASLRFSFPSEHYAFEDQAYGRYAPREVNVPINLLTALTEGRRTPEMEPFVRQCVFVGMPARYR